MPTKSFCEEASESNEQAARIIKYQEDYLAQSRAYTEISERAYLNTMGTVE
jgi:TRAP-type mannitol/chloroaromatic compound transport system substrate-binding protein